MNEDKAYLDISKRFLESCELHIHHGINIQEVIGFKSYHAFESIGGAYNSHYGHSVPRNHVRKLNSFVTNSNQDTHVNFRAIAALAMMLNSMRNKYLYPEERSSTFIKPEDQISMTDVRLIVRRVRSVIRKIERLI